jgi:glycosyltransferase involved in cell wall biosynthesis
VVRILEPDERSSDDEAVVGAWVTGDAGSLRRAVHVLASYDVVMLQHEFRLFGGPDGRDVLELADGVVSPLIVVLHTIPHQPSVNQREIIDQLVAASRMVVVQAEAARERLRSVYGVDPAKVTVIAHGAALNVAGPTIPGIPRPAVVTWGLLKPGKGMEHAIAAIARLGDRSPAPVYVIAGQTHPKYIASGVESYRELLRAEAVRLGVADRILFEPGYQDQESLRALARTADVVLLPYESREAVSSGVLVEALAAGKPVVATRFPHAVELLSGGAGLLVDHEDAEAMAAAIGRVLYEPGLAARLAVAARHAAAPLMWQAVGERYLELLDNVADGFLAA